MVKLAGFQSQLEASCMSCHTEELWYSETVCGWQYIYIYIVCVCVYVYIYIYIYIYIYSITIFYPTRIFHCKEMGVLRKFVMLTRGKFCISLKLSKQYVTIIRKNHALKKFHSEQIKISYSLCFLEKNHPK